MTRLRLVILERDERTVLRHLGCAGVVQLTRTPAGTDTAPLSPRDRSEEFARLERISSRLENLRRSLELSGTGGTSVPLPAETSLALAEKNISTVEEQSGVLLKRRQQLQQRLAEATTICEQISDYRELELPLDQPDDASLLHFVTGSLPAKNFEKLQPGRETALLPLTERNGRQFLIVMTTRHARPELDHALQQVGFQLEKLPVMAGTTTTALAKQKQGEQEHTADEIERLNSKLKSLAEEFAPAWAQMETVANTERRLLEAEQNFPRTESSVLITGWIPSADVLELKQRVQEITNGRCVVETTPAENLFTHSSRCEMAPSEIHPEKSEPPHVGCYDEEEIPVLLRHPRWLRPFEILVTAYGLPKYRELEPTLFVAFSYLLMFGMMFGDAGHGFVLTLGGLVFLFTSRRTPLRDIGLLLLFAGCASMISGAIYGSYFGLPQFRKYALWHDPLEGNTTGLLLGAVKIGIVMISFGLILNIINRFRHGDFIGGLLDKFGAAGVVFYWGALMLLTKSTAIRVHGLWIPAILIFLVAPVIAWLMKEPIQTWHSHRAGARVVPTRSTSPDLKSPKVMNDSKSPPAAAWDKPRSDELGDVFTIIMESFSSMFEGLISYLANTISFVRLAAYAMSHAALLLAAFMIADDVRHFSPGGSWLGVLVIIFGNLLAIVLEGIVASVQALRLEYYEFFGKFFSGGGRPFQPFCLQTNTVANTPL